MTEAHRSTIELYEKKVKKHKPTKEDVLDDLVTSRLVSAGVGNAMMKAQEGLCNLAKDVIKYFTS